MGPLFCAVCGGAGVHLIMGLVMGSPFLDGLGSKTKNDDVFLAYLQPFDFIFYYSVMIDYDQFVVAFCFGFHLILYIFLAKI